MFEFGKPLLFAGAAMAGVEPELEAGAEAPADGTGGGGGAAKAAAGAASGNEATATAEVAFPVGVCPEVGSPSGSPSTGAVPATERAFVLLPGTGGES